MDLTFASKTRLEEDILVMRNMQTERAMAKMTKRESLMATRTYSRYMGMELYSFWCRRTATAQAMLEMMKTNTATTTTTRSGFLQKKEPVLKFTKIKIQSNV